MLAMKTKTMLTIATAAVALAVLGGAAVSAQDKYSLKVPGGLAFSEFKGYEDWAVISVGHTDDLVKVIVGNPVVMNAFRAGVPGNGKPFPDGSKMAKVEWRPKKKPDAPYDFKMPGPIYDLDFMVKDAKRFPDSNGWGYAVFVYDAPSDRRTTPSVGPRATR
jgi:Cytochrome P460